MYEVRTGLVAGASFHQKLGTGNLNLHDKQGKTRPFCSSPSPFQVKGRLFITPQVRFDLTTNDVDLGLGLKLRLVLLKGTGFVD